MLDLATLLERCRRGDDLAWEALVRRYQARVYSVAVHYLRDREEARDAAQEIFVRIYQRLDSFRGHERFLPWMLSVARNCCIDRLRRLKVRTPSRRVSLDEDLEISAPGRTAEEQADTERRKRLLHRALHRLSDKNREMIVLKEIQGLKLEQIAELLVLPVGTVKSRSSRARIELAKAIRVLDPSWGA